jgi:hypothetical protein
MIFCSHLCEPMCEEHEVDRLPAEVGTQRETMVTVINPHATRVELKH